MRLNFKNLFITLIAFRALLIILFIFSQLVNFLKRIKLILRMQLE